MGSDRIYYNGTYNYEEMLETIKYNGDFWFCYKEQAYYLTDITLKQNKPCVIKYYYGEKPEEVLEYFKTFEELIHKFKFDDGVSFLEALSSKYITNA